MTSSIHKHCRPTIKQEKARTKKQYFCKYCPPQDPAGYHASTIRLQRHLKKHSVEWSPEENQPHTTVKDQGEQALQQLYEKLLARQEIQELEGEVLRRTIQKNAIKETLLNLIIVRRLPFSIVEWKEFHAFVNALNREATSVVSMSHTTIANWIHDHFSETQDLIRKVLQSAKTKLHLAVDIWTSSSHALLLGICASFVDIHDKYRNPLIALRTVNSQSGEDQWETLRPVLQEYGIETKIGALVGDNAGSNDVLCRIISSHLSIKHNINWNSTHQRIRCQGHVINLIVQAFLFDSKKDHELLQSYDEEDERLEEMKDEEDQNDEEEIRRQELPSTIKRKRKKRAEASESSSDKKKSNDRDQSVQMMMGSLGKLHNHVVHIRRSANRTTWFVERAGKMISLDNRTRWNSWFLMLRTALEQDVKSSIQFYVEEYDQDFLDENLITTIEWKQLRTIHDFLEFFYDATLALQGDRMTLERVLETLGLLKDHIDETLRISQNVKDNFMIPRLLRAQQKLKKYLVKLDESPYYLAAQILDPQCRLSFLKDKNSGEMLEEGKRKLFLVRKLWERFRNITTFSASYDTVQQSKPTSESIKHLSAFHLRRRQNIEEHTRPQSEDEFDLYIKDSPIPLGDRTSIQWWNDSLQRTRFPRLGRLANEVLSIPGMSDKPERVFSGSRRRVPWDRTKTSPQRLEQTECMKDWIDYEIVDILL